MKKQPRISEKYLLENTKEAEEMRENLRQLLESAEEENIRLAFTLIESGGLHKTVATYLLVSSLWNKSEALQNRADKIIKEHLPLKISQKWLLEDQVTQKEKTTLSRYYRYSVDEKQFCRTLEKVSRRNKTVDKRILGMGTLKMTGRGAPFCLKHKLAPVKEILSELVVNNELRLKGFELTEFPSEVLDFVNLRLLDIDGNKFRTLPENFESLVNLEDIYYGNTRLRANEIKRLEKMMPSCMGKIHYSHTTIPSRFREPEQAIISLKKVIKLNPENINGWNDLAMCYFQINQPKKATITLQNALEYYAKNMPIMPTSDYLLGKSCTFALLNDKEQAFKLLAEACKISPDCKQKVKAKDEFRAYFNDEMFKEITK